MDDLGAVAISERVCGGDGEASWTCTTYCSARRQSVSLHLLSSTFTIAVISYIWLFVPFLGWVLHLPLPPSRRCHAHTCHKTGTSWENFQLSPPIYLEAITLCHYRAGIDYGHVLLTRRASKMNSSLRPRTCANVGAGNLTYTCWTKRKPG